MSHPYFDNEYLPSNTFLRAKLEEMKTNNDDYLANKAMYRELHKIELLVLGQNNLYGSSSVNPVTYTYTYTKTSISGNDYFGTLMQKLSLMFPDMFIYYTPSSDSHDLTFNSIRYTTASSYVPSTVSITNVLFISQTELTIPTYILDGQFVFSYIKNGITAAVAKDLLNLPLIFETGVFVAVDISASISEGSVTVIVNTKYYPNVNTNSDFGLTFKKNFFLGKDDNDLFPDNLYITTLTNIPLSKIGSQFISLLSISIATGQNPIIRSGTSLASCFSSSNFNSNISGWNTTNVTNMSYMFSNASVFDSDISGWDTSNVTDMSNMFYNAGNFNSDISGWDTSNVTDMSSMFYNNEGTYKFNQDVGKWDVNNVINMSDMFTNYKLGFFNNGDVLGGKTKKMNWTINANLVSTRWHYWSPLTYDNAPDDLQSTW